MLKLVWNELQQGSQYIAEKFDSISTPQALQRMLSTPQIVKAGIAHLVEREVSRYQVILDMRRVEVQRFVADISHYIQISQAPSDLH